MIPWRNIKLFEGQSRKIKGAPFKHLKWSLLLCAITVIICLLMFSTEDFLQNPRNPQDNPHTSLSFKKMWEMETEGGKRRSLQDNRETGVSLNNTWEPKILKISNNMQNSQNYKDTLLSIHRNLTRVPDQNGPKNYHYTGFSSNLESLNLYTKKYQAKNIQKDSRQIFHVSQTHDLVHGSLFYQSPTFLQYLSSRMTVTDKLFKSRLKKNERQMLYKILQQLQNTCLSLNITCIMYGGTLLGSWRHHHMIPWDDDADVLVNIAEKNRLYKALDNLYPKYQVTLYQEKLKFYSQNSTKTSKAPWKWPFMDIWFYSENETHIWDEVSIKNYQWDYTYHKNSVFPVHLRPFGKLLLFAPKDTYHCLKVTYGTTDCATHSFNHKLDKFQTWREKSVSCRLFEKTIGFVHRQLQGTHIRETLFLGSQKIHSVLVNEPPYAITDPFQLTLIV